MECSDIISLRLDNGQQGVRHKDSIDDITRQTVKPNKNGGYFGFGGEYNENEPYQGPYYDYDFNLRSPDGRILRYSSSPKRTFPGFDKA